MSGCRLQAREAQQQQQPTTNERLMAARARAPHEAERQRGAHQRAVVNDGKRRESKPVAASQRSTTEATNYNQ